MNVSDILHDIKALRVLVVGDICLDRWCYYNPALSEESRETGIPRIGVVRTLVTPGAGGTIANNLVALGVEDVAVLGAIGDDGFGFELQRALRARNISGRLLVSGPEICTFTYTKVINDATGEEDRPRLDHINTQPLAGRLENLVVQTLESHFRDYDVVIVSDQAETDSGGIVTTAVRERLVDLANTYRDRIVWVDSRMRSELFRQVVLKPNCDEMEAACRRKFGTTDPKRLFEENQLRALIITHGCEGAQVLAPDGESWAGTRKVAAVDICGAGDSFSAGAACALAATGSPLEAARFGNLVASITVTKKGTGTASPAELLEFASEMPR
jgi:rfaE bifunctional protein kinase chain/domain